MALANLRWDGETPEPGYPAGLPGEVSTYLGLTPVLSGVTQPDGVTTLDDVLLDIIDLNYLQTIMATGGEGAWQILKDAMTGSDVGGVLCVEGAIPTNDNKYCTVGSKVDGTGELFVGDVVADIANQAAGKGRAGAVLAIGTCASFGGVPGANSDAARPKTGAKSVSSYLAGLVGTYAPVVNVPGYVLGDLLSNLDDYGRPKFYYGSTNHGGRCLRYQGYCEGQFLSLPGDNDVYFSTVTMKSERKCLAMLGCKGFSAYADCVFGGPSATQKGRGWNVVGRDTSGNVVSGGNSCINNGWPCMGCTEKAFPDRFSPFLRTL
jgi:Ni,Fe-hydrogenase I small subunit